MTHSTSTAIVLHQTNPAHGHQAAQDVIVDALPYYDSGYDEPGVREAVSQAILLNLIYVTHLISRLLV